jgi:ribonuclease T1
MARTAGLRFLLVRCLTLVFCGVALTAQARSANPEGWGLSGADRTVSTGALPPEAQTTLKLISRGGPFPHDKDGTVFGNRERQLPAHPRGYYREYTVNTPGARDRGARRIVCGSSTPPACFYSDDHYASFRRIVD